MYRETPRLEQEEDDAADDDDSCKCVFLVRGFRIRFSFGVNEFAIAPLDYNRTARTVGR